MLQGRRRSSPRKRRQVDRLDSDEDDVDSLPELGLEDAEVTPEAQRILDTFANKLLEQLEDSHVKNIVFVEDNKVSERKLFGKSEDKICTDKKDGKNCISCRLNSCIEPDLYLDMAVDSESTPVDSESSKPVDSESSKPVDSESDKPIDSESGMPVISATPVKSGLAHALIDVKTLSEFNQEASKLVAPLQTSNYIIQDSNSEVNTSKISVNSSNEVKSVKSASEVKSVNRASIEVTHELVTQVGDKIITKVRPRSKIKQPISKTVHEAIQETLLETVTDNENNSTNIVGQMKGVDLSTKSNVSSSVTSPSSVKNIASSDLDTSLITPFKTPKKSDTFVFKTPQKTPRTPRTRHLLTYRRHSLLSPQGSRRALPRTPSRVPFSPTQIDPSTSGLQTSDRTRHNSGLSTPVHRDQLSAPTTPTSKNIPSVPYYTPSPTNSSPSPAPTPGLKFLQVSFIPLSYTLWNQVIRFLESICLCKQIFIYDSFGVFRNYLPQILYQ